MSTTTVEHGTIKFTKSGYTQIMRQMRDTFNARQDYFFLVAEAAYQTLSKTKNPTRSDAIDLFQSFDHGQKMRFAGMPTNRQFWVNENSLFEIIDELFRGKNGNMNKPRKTGFKKLTNREKEYTVETHMGHFTFHEANAFLEWNVTGNNNSVRDCHQDCMSIALFKTLKAYKWKRGEGGKFYYGDEYMWGWDEGEYPDDCDRKMEVSHSFGHA